jgi:hypothetical protein
VPVAAAAAVVAVVAATSLVPGMLRSVARQAGALISANPTSANPTSVKPAYPPDLTAGLTGLFVTASGPQQTQGALFMGEYKALEGQVFARCMAGAGFRVPVPTPAQIASTLQDLSQFPDLTAIARAGMMPGNGRPEAGSLHGSKAYLAAYHRCDAASNDLFHATMVIGRSLMRQFLPVVTTIQGSPAVLAAMPAVRACAARYGWPHDPYGPDRPINSFDQYVTWVTSHLDGALSRGASITVMRQLDVHWAPIFVQCARPAVTVMERLQLVAQRRYLAVHRDRFGSLVAAAKADFARAERLAHG